MATVENMLDGIERSPATVGMVRVNDARKVQTYCDGVVCGIDADRTWPVCVLLRGAPPHGCWDAGDAHRHRSLIAAALSAGRVVTAGLI